MVNSYSFIFVGQLKMKMLKMPPPHPDGFGWNFWRKVQARSIKFYTLIEDKWPHKSAGNCIASSFRSAAKYY